MAPPRDCRICDGPHPSQCPTCGNREKDDWWWVASCVYCGKKVCGSIVDRKQSLSTSSNCWVKHMLEAHPEKVTA